MAEITVTAQNFEAEVLKADKPVVVDFWATWCGPCRMLAPILAEVAEEHKTELKVGKVNIDDEAVLADKFGIDTIPTLLLFKNGEVVKSSVGLLSKAQLEEFLLK